MTSSVLEKTSIHPSAVIHPTATGKSYLSNKGFPNMKETYFMKQGNTVTINYVYKRDSFKRFS